MTPRVEFLWWEGCPSHERALAELREAMARAGLDPDAVEVREVDTEEDAAREAFVGSPTIRIDGRDVQPPDDEPRWANVPGLPVARRPRLPDSRSGRPARRSDGGDEGRVTMAELSIGDQAPGFELPDTEGATHAFPADGGRPTAIVFTCNHCPYALAWHDRILDVARDYEPRACAFC